MSATRAALFALLALATAARADDWPAFRGPARDGVSREAGLPKAWPKDGPPLRWSIDTLGHGYSGPAVVGDRLYVSAARRDDEFLIALDLTANPPKELWATKIGPTFTWKGNSWNRGPSATPTVHDGAVYALGGFGDLVSADAATGKERWRTNLPKDLGGEVNPIGGGLEEPTALGWGYAHAPLVDGDHVICVPGGPRGLLAALDRKTGKPAWRSADANDRAPYASPVLATLAGVRQIVQVTNAGLAGFDPATGKRLWAYARQPAYDDVVVAAPVIWGDLVFSSVGFGQGCDCVRVTAAAAGGALKAEKVYSNKAVQNRDGGLVVIDGNAYGHSENRGWVCVELATGTVKWSDKDELGRGSVTAAGGVLYCAAEKGGAIALVEATPAGRKETGRLTLPRESNQRPSSGGLWTHPVVANGRLYIRDQESLYCYDLK
ncbi:MAG TPA: PQQ-binding-like beta-propeller repeat protein [Tepidisphaeraceae bacterium]|nr:PQQ-binding-like beta-propeller repeat protein [Tepidisphaeraceae bacterium]